MVNGNKQSLFRGSYCGTNSGTIYEKYCDMFGWDETQASQFGSRGAPLFARKATPEGYNVWCISYSNWCGGYGGKWRNYISCNGEKIEELWETLPIKEDEWHDFHDTTCRVVFAKKKEGHYEFLGVYKYEGTSAKPEKPAWSDVSGYIRTYKRISEYYPIGR